jgi:hypothetical protein
MYRYMYVAALMPVLVAACGPPVEGSGPATAPGGARAGAPDPTAVPTCPAGFTAQTDQNAKTECSGKLGVQVVSQSGDAAAMCVNEAGSAYKCVAPQSFSEICQPNGVQRITREEITCFPPAAIAALNLPAAPPAAATPPPPPHTPTKEEICRSATITDCGQDRACHSSCGGNHGCDEGCSGKSNFAKANGCWHGKTKC